MLAQIPLGGDIVADYYIENTHILICDAAYAGKGPEHTRRVLEEAAQASLNIIRHNQSNHL